MKKEKVDDKLIQTKIQKIKKDHLKMGKEIKVFKETIKKEKSELFLVVELSVLEFIFHSDITKTAKLILIYFLSKIDFGYNHLLLYMPYKQMVADLKIDRKTISTTIKLLEEKKFLRLYSGLNRIENKMLKEEIIFNQKQFFNPFQNQQNIIDMIPFYQNFFEHNKKVGENEVPY